MGGVLLENEKVWDDVDGYSGCEEEEEEVEDLLDDVPNLVLAGLYIGSVDAETNNEALEQRSITHVLTVGDLGPEHSSTSPHIREYCTIDIEDDPTADIISKFETCFEFIDRGRRTSAVLVHCLAGRSRSVTILIAYLMWRSNAQVIGSEQGGQEFQFRTLDAARSHLEMVRPWIQPNPGFMAQLRLFEEHGCDITTALRHLGHVLVV